VAGSRSNAEARFPASANMGHEGETTMQTYVAQKAHRQLPAGQKHALEINQPDAASSAAVAQMGEMLNRSPRVRAQMQLQRMLNQSPAVVAQRKLAKTLSRRTPIQRADMLDEEELAQAKLEPAQRQGDALREPEEEETLQGKFEPVQREKAVDQEETLQGKLNSVQRDLAPDSEQARPHEPNHTGLPDNLKAGVEALSGFSLSDVRVHYNSPQPAQLHALAYAQGSDIHVAPAQERHLPHEAWHVVQQKQGRVKPTLQAKGVPINDDAGLEGEAEAVANRTDNFTLAEAQAPSIVKRNLFKSPTFRSVPLLQFVTNDDFFDIQKRQFIAVKNIMRTSGRVNDLDGLLKNVSKDAMEQIIDTYVAHTSFFTSFAWNIYLLDVLRDPQLLQRKRIEQGETLVAASMSKHEKLRGFPKQHIWKMLMDAKHHKTRGKYGFENEKGYMGAMMNSLHLMLGTVDQKPLSADLYEQLHDAAVRGVSDREGLPMEQSYRSDRAYGAAFGLDMDTWSPGGHAELLAKYRRRAESDEFVGHMLEKHPDKMLKRSDDGQQLLGRQDFRVRPLGPVEAHDIAKGVISRYHNEIESAENEDERLTAIARICQDLDQLHLFADGNIRTVVFLLLNKLLLEQGFSPVIMHEPNVFDGKSVSELKALIKAGQAKYESVKHSSSSSDGS
jgi:hypothetical protein